MLCSRDGVTAGRIHHNDPMPGCFRNIDIVYANTGSNHKLQVFGCLQDFRIYRGCGTDDQPMGL